MCFHYDKTGPVGHSLMYRHGSSDHPHYLFVQISQAVGTRPQSVLESLGRSSWPDHLWIIRNASSEASECSILKPFKQDVGRMMSFFSLGLNTGYIRSFLLDRTMGISAKKLQLYNNNSNSIKNLCSQTFD